MTGQVDKRIDVIRLDRRGRHLVGLRLSATHAAVHHLPTLALANEFDWLHQAATDGQPISRSSIIDVH
jgi:hypothetical protein